MGKINMNSDTLTITDDYGRIIYENKGGHTTINILADEINIDSEVKVEEPTDEELDNMEDEYIEDMLDDYLDDILNIEGCPICRTKEILEDLFWTAFDMGYNAEQEDIEESED